MGVAELWATVEKAITAYTGLSPPTFFTVLAISLAVYYAVSSFFEPAPAPKMIEGKEESAEPLPPPVLLGEITEEELSAYDGSDPKKPPLMAIKGQIHDVTQSRKGVWERRDSGGFVEGEEEGGGRGAIVGGVEEAGLRSLRAALEERARRGRKK